MSLPCYPIPWLGIGTGILVLERWWENVNQLGHPSCAGVAPSLVCSMSMSEVSIRKGGSIYSKTLGQMWSLVCVCLDAPPNTWCRVCCQWQCCYGNTLSITYHWSHICHVLVWTALACSMCSMQYSKYVQISGQRTSIIELFVEVCSKNPLA